MFDAITLAAIADELRATILHGRVQDITQLDALTFGFEIYAQHARRYFFVTAHPDDARAHLVAQKLRGSGATPSAFLALLRKYGEGALLNTITQLPHERVLQIQLDHSAEGISTLVVETIGKYANVILLAADGVVLDAVKRVPATLNRARVILPHHVYVPPPPQAKLDPARLTAPALARALADHAGEALPQALVKTIAGVSPLLAREIAYRVAARTDAADILGVLNDLHTPWQPCVAFEDSAPAAFAPYSITHLSQRQSFTSISTALEFFYGAPEAYAAAKEPLRAQIAEARDKLARKRDALAQEQARAGDVERLRVSGEMILAYAHQIAHNQERLIAETETGALAIPLNPQWSAIANAQRYFKDYHRAKDAAARVPALLAAANIAVAFAEQMLNDLELAENRAELDAVIAAAREAGLIAEKQKRGRVTQGAPRVFTSTDGFTILVGKNARQNEEITFQRARADDLWLHAHNIAGAHVIIVRAGREITPVALNQAAALAAQYSPARDEPRVEVIVTPRKNVHRIRGAHRAPGMVTVRESQIVVVVR